MKDARAVRGWFPKRAEWGLVASISPVWVHALSGTMVKRNPMARRFPREQFISDIDSLR